ncbi:MAG: HAD family phosphatase [Gilvibacter sp.]
MNLKAIIFDMDGVIVDTEPLHGKAYRQMFDEVGIDVSDALYRSFTGQSTNNISKRLVSHFDLTIPPEELTRVKRKYFNELFDNDPDLTLIDGFYERLQEYHAADLPIVVASSASMENINRVFNRFELNPFFKAKFSGADVPKSKPHPELFLKAAAATGYSTNECMVIEDSTNGVKAAHAAGIFCVGFNSVHSKDQDYSLANVVIEDFKEISLANLSRLMT